MERGEILERISARLADRTRPTASATWSDAVDWVSSWAFMLLVGGTLTLTAVPIVQDLRAQPAATAGVLALLGMSWVLAVQDLRARGRERGRHLAAVLFLTLVAITLAYPTIPPAVPTVVWWPIYPLYLLGMYLIAVTYGSVVGWVSTLLATGGVLLTVHVALPVGAEEAARLGAIQLVQVAAVLATTDLWVRGLRRIALESDRLETARMTDLRSTSRAGREAQRLRDVERFIHDEVLHTLRAIAMERGDLPGSQVRAWATRLSGQLGHTAARADVPRADQGADPHAGQAAGQHAPQHAAPQADLPPAPPAATPRPSHDDLVARLQALDVAVHVAWRVPGRADVPTEVADAVVAATAEALRNVHRHARVTAAHVHLRTTRTGIEVTVRDEGVGFDPREPRLTRHGVARSVLGRMNDLGGTATVDSAPGAGTTVSLRWEPRVPHVGGRTFPWHDATVRDVVRRCTLVLYPSAVAAILVTLIVLPRLESPLLALAAVAVIGAVVPVVPKYVAARGMTGVGSMTLLALGVSATLALGFAASSGTASAYEVPAIGYAALVPIVVLFSRPLWEGVLGWVLITAAAALVALTHLATTAELALMWTIILTPGMGVGAAVVLRAALDVFGRSTYLANDARARALGEVARTQEVRATVAQRLDQVSKAVRPFLDDVAAGRLDVADTAVRARADELERAVREDLSLGEAPGVKRAVECLREAGASVALRCPPDPPQEVDDVVQRMALLLRSSWDAWATHTPDLGLTITPRGEAWAIALLSSTPDDAAAADLAAAWREVLGEVGASVMAVASDVRARVAVPTAVPSRAGTAAGGGPVPG